MRWQNKGHEYDETYARMSLKRAWYLFGAGDYGRQFYNIFRDEINILGFVDNDTVKYGSKTCGLSCVPLADVERSEEVGIILTMSQIARINPITQLEASGYRRNIDYFIIEEFLSVYFVYKYDRIYFSSISFLPSTRCNLNCRHCLNFNPFAKGFYNRELTDVRADIDLFFKCVDRIMLFHVSGGEPFLYPHFVEVLSYIDRNYGDRIDTLRTVTNGTVVPRDEILSRMSELDVELTVDDYRDSVPDCRDNFDRLIFRLDEYGIRYYINHVDSWIDLAPERTDYSGHTDEQMISHRNMCAQSWEELRDGKIFSCNYAAYAEVAGMNGGDETEEYFDLRNFNPSFQKELVEFRLGYSDKGYTNFCRKCRGFTPENTEEVTPAAQMAR